MHALDREMAYTLKAQETTAHRATIGALNAKCSARVTPVVPFAVAREAEMH